VNPLVIAGGLGEQVDALLIDFQPVAVTQMLPDCPEERLGMLKYGTHAFNSHA
jgi:hypothetical protein